MLHTPLLRLPGYVKLCQVSAYDNMSSDALFLLANGKHITY
jgi:hypothetical protein